MNTCAACHGNMTRQKGIIDLRIDGKLYVIKNVDYEVCEICGEKVISPDVSSRVYENIKNRRYIEETITVPVLDCA